ncbi:hypothetical protein STBA_57130 [Streptomyces sp. MP131-18]|nr:hypothetical protein STBA_57130 [Streptomyces sp. MP131-18]
MRPDTGHGDSGISSPLSSSLSAALSSPLCRAASWPDSFGSGAPAITTWQFVPPTPKELTPANSWDSGHGRAVVCTRRFSASGSMCGLGVS